MSTDFTDLGVDTSVVPSTMVDLTPQPSDKASVLKQKREQKIDTLSPKVATSNNLTDTTTYLPDDTYASNLNKVWNDEDPAGLQSAFNAAMQYSLRQDNDNYYYTGPDGAEVPYTGPVRRLYGYNTKVGDGVKYGITRGDIASSNDRFTPTVVNGEEYGWEPGPEGVDINKPLLFDRAGNAGVLLPEDMARLTEGMIHGNQSALEHRLARQLGYEDAKARLGSGFTEYYDSKFGVLGNPANADTEISTEEAIKVGREILNKYAAVTPSVDISSLTGAPVNRTVERPLSISESIDQKVNEYHRDDIPYRAVNAVQGTLSLLAKGLVVDTVDVVGELINYSTGGRVGWDVGTNEEKREYVSDFFNYNTAYSDEAAAKAKEHIQNVYEALKDPKKQVDLGDVVGAVYEGTTPEMAAEAIGYVLAMAVGLGKFTLMGKAVNGIKKAITSGKITKEEGAKQLKDLKKATSIANKATYTAAKNAGVLNVAAAQTSEDIDVYKSLNEGEGPGTLTVLRMYGVQVALNALEKTVDLSILRGVKLTPNAFKKQAAETAKDAVEASTLSTLPLLLKQSAKLVGKLGAAGTTEAVQEYVQTLGTSINQQYGTKIAGDDLYNLLTNTENQIEAFTGAALGAGTGVVMRTPSAVMQSIPARDPNSDRSIQKQVNKLPKGTQQVLEEEANITGKSTIETAKDYRQVLYDMQELVGEDNTVTPENLNRAVNALDLLNRSDDVLKNISQDKVEVLKEHKERLSGRVTSFLKEVDAKDLKLGSLLSPENPEQGKNKVLRLLLHTVTANPSTLPSEDYKVLRSIAAREGINESVVPGLFEDGYSKAEYEATIADNGYITKEIQLSRMLDNGIPNTSQFTKTLNQLKAWHQTTLRGVQQLQDTVNQAEANAALLNEGKAAPKKVLSEYVKTKSQNKPFDILVRKDPQTGLYYADTKTANDFINNKLRTANSINGIAHHFNEVVSNSSQAEEVKAKILPILQNTIEDHSNFFGGTNPATSSTELQPIHKKVEAKAARFLDNYDIPKEDRNSLTADLLNRIKDTTDSAEIQSISDQFKQYISSNYKTIVDQPSTDLSTAHQALIDEAKEFLSKYKIPEEKRKNYITDLSKSIENVTDEAELQSIFNTFKSYIDDTYEPLIQDEVSTETDNAVSVETSTTSVNDLTATAKEVLNEKGIPVEHYRAVNSELTKLYESNGTVDRKELELLIDTAIKTDKESSDSSKIHISKTAYEQLKNAVKNPITEGGKEGAAKALKLFKSLKLPKKARFVFNPHIIIDQIENRYEHIKPEGYNRVINSIYKQVTHIGKERSTAKTEAKELKEDAYRIVDEVLDSNDEVKTQATQLLDTIDTDALVTSSKKRNAKGITQEVANALNEAIHSIKTLQDKSTLKQAVEGAETQSPKVAELQPIHKAIETKAIAFMDNYDIPEKDRESLISGLLKLIKRTTNKGNLQSVSGRFKRYISKAYTPTIKEEDGAEVPNTPVNDLVAAAKEILKEKSISVEHYNAVSSELVELHKSNDPISKQQLEILIEEVIKNSSQQSDQAKTYISSVVHKRFIEALKTPITEDGEKGALEAIKRLKGIKFPKRVQKALNIDGTVKSLQKNYKKLTASDYDLLLHLLFEGVTHIDSERTAAKVKARKLKKNTYRIISKVLEVDDKVKTEIRQVLESIDTDALVDNSKKRKADHIVEEVVNKLNSVVQFTKELQSNYDDKQALNNKSTVQNTSTSKEVSKTETSTSVKKPAKDEASENDVSQSELTEKVPDAVQEVIRTSVTGDAPAESINQKLKTARQLGNVLYKNTFTSIEERLTAIKALIKELPSKQRKEFNKHYSLFGYALSKDQKNTVVIPPTAILSAAKYAYSKTFLDKSSWNVPTAISKLETVPASVGSLYRALKESLTASSSKEFMGKFDKALDWVKTSRLRDYLTAKRGDDKATKDRIQTIIEVFIDKKHEKNKPHKLVLNETLNHVNHTVSVELRYLADYKYQATDTKIYKYLTKETVGSQHDTINTKLLPLDSTVGGGVNYKVLSKKTPLEELEKLTEQGLLRTVNLNPANYVKVGKVTELNSIDMVNVFPLKHPVLWSFYQEEYPLVHEGGIENLANPIYAYSYKEAAGRAIKGLTKDDRRLFSHLYDSPARGLLFNKSGEVNDSVLMAMQIAATSHVFFNRNNLLPGFKPDSVVARMFDVEDVNVTPEMRSFAYAHGTPVRTMAHDTGSVVASLLGLKERASDTVNIGEYDHLLADLGHIALRALGSLRVGNTEQDSVALITFEDVLANNYAKAAGLPYSESNNATIPYASVAYVGDPTVGETAVHKNTVAYFDHLSEELHTFSDITNEGKYPYFKPIPDSVIDQYIGKVYKDLVGLEIPKASKQTMRAMMKTPYTATKEELTTFVGYLNTPEYKQGILKHLGYIDVKTPQYTKLSHQDKLSQKGKNMSIEEALDTITDLHERFDEVSVDGVAKMYFPVAYLVNGRFYYNSTTINPQNDKLHRFMFLPEGLTVNVTVDRLEDGIKVISSKSKDITTSIYRGVVQAFGVDIEKTKTKDIKRIGTILSSLPLEEVQRLRKDVLLGKQPEVQEVENLGFKLEVENIAHILTALQFLEDANTKKDIVTKIAYEEDVKTSGFSNKLQQFPVLTDNEKEQAVLLARTGVFTPEYVGKINEKEVVFDPVNGKGANDVFASKESIGLSDSYEAQAEEVIGSLRHADFVGEDLTVKGRKWADSLIKLTPFSAANDISESTASLITSELRKVFKNPFMIFNYSAGLNRIIRNVSESTITTIVSNLAKKSEKGLTKDEQHFVNLLLKVGIEVSVPSKESIKIRNTQHLIQALREYPIAAFKTKQPQYLVNVKGKEEDPTVKVTYNLHTSGELVKDLENLLLGTVGKSVRHAFITKFERFIEIQDAMNDVFRLSFMVFEQKLEAQLKEKLKGKNVLTKKDLEDSIEDLSNVLPYINGPLSEEGKRDGIAVVKSKVRANLDAILHPRKAPQAHTYNEQGVMVKKTVQAISRTLAMASNAGAVIGFHTLDGAEVSAVVNHFARRYKGEGTDITTIHDAFIAPVDSAGETGKTLHKAMYDLNKEYDMFNEVAELLKRVTSPEVLESIDTSKIDFENLNYFMGRGKELTKYMDEEVIEVFKDDIFSLNEHILLAKELDYAPQGVFSQAYYGTLGGGDTDGIRRGNGDKIRPMEDSSVSKVSESLTESTDDENPIILGSSPATQFTKALKGCS